MNDRSRNHHRHHQNEAEMNQRRDAVYQRRLTLPGVSFVVHACFYHHLRLGVGVSYSSNVLLDVTILQTTMQLRTSVQHLTKWKKKSNTSTYEK